MGQADMSARSIIDITHNQSITIAPFKGRLIFAVADETDLAEVVLTPEQIDELVRALAVARTALAKAAQ